MAEIVICFAFFFRLAVKQGSNGHIRLFELATTFRSLARSSLSVCALFELLLIYFKLKRQASSACSILFAQTHSI